MKTKWFFFTLVLVALLASACAPAATPTAAPAAPAAPAATSAPAMPAESAPSASSAGSGQVPAVKRIVIKNATLSIVVKDPAFSVTAIGKMAENLGGFIVSSNVQSSQGQNGIEYPQATISIRVPADQLDFARQQIKAQVSDLGKGMIDEQVSGSDVTKEYTDLQSRLTNLQNASDQLKVIMDKASKTEDVMSVYNQLTQVNEQIEVLKGQIKYYDEASNLSEIAVTLKSEESIKPITVEGWEPAGVARNALQALVNTLQGIANSLIWFGLYLLPVLFVFALLIGIPIIIVLSFIKAFNHPHKPQGPTVD